MRGRPLRTGPRRPALDAPAPTSAGSSTSGPSAPALGARDDLAYVLVFENNGAEVGATIPHPHEQIYAWPDVPPVPAGELARLADGHRLLEDDRPELVVVEATAGGPGCPRRHLPYGMQVAPLERRPDLPSLADAERDAFASVLAEALRRLEGVFDPAMPYLFWIHQRPFDGAEHPEAWLHVEVAGPTDRPASCATSPGPSWQRHLPEPGATRRCRRRPARRPRMTADEIVARARAREPDRRPHRLRHGLVLPMAIDLGTTVTGRRGRPRGARQRHRARGGPRRPRRRRPGRRVPGLGPLRRRRGRGAPAEHRLLGTVTTTLPVGAGLSSSAALEVAVVRARLRRRPLALAQLAQAAEQRASGVPCRIMDQLASAAGVAGAVLIDCRSLEVAPVVLPDDVEVRVVHSGQERQLAGSEYAERRRRRGGRRRPPRAAARPRRSRGGGRARRSGPAPAPGT
ncbi:MAG: hypothetical protein R2711_08410 [Acidimicrobiales bacterium]